MKKALITGGAGFIGSHLADALVSQGYKVAVVDDLSTGSKRNINPAAVFFKADIKSPAINHIFKKVRPDVVFHFAADASVAGSLHSPAASVATNILGSVNVLEYCKEFKVKKIVFASSCAVYGQAKKIPTGEMEVPKSSSPYAISKLIVEQYLQISGLDFVALRFSNVYGPRQKNGVIARFVNEKLPVIYGNGRQTRDFLYVGDAVAAVMAAMKTKETGIFNIGTGRETTVNKVFAMIGGARKAKYMAEYRAQQRSSLNYQKAKKILGWQPKISLQKGINQMMQ